MSIIGISPRHLPLRFGWVGNSTTWGCCCETNLTTTFMPAFTAVVAFFLTWHDLQLLLMNNFELEKKAAKRWTNFHFEKINSAKWVEWRSFFVDLAKRIQICLFFFYFHAFCLLIIFVWIAMCRTIKESTMTIFHSKYGSFFLKADP